MKVILKADIKGVGKKDQVINASDGYARNFLFPKNLAVPADNSNMIRLESKKEAVNYKKAIELEEAKKLANKIQGLELKLSVKCGDNGKIFGSITSKEISSNLKEQYKIDIDKKKILLKDTIKELGIFTVDIKLYEGVSAKLKIKVINE